jgi:tetratricopeptide (TPR) repeat protein
MKRIKTPYIFLILGLVILFHSGCTFRNGVRGGYYSLKHNIQGKHYLDNEKYNEGIQAFKEELAKNPDSAEAHYYMGRCLMGVKRYKDALKHLSSAASLAPKEADYHFWLGVAFNKNGQKDSERSSYERALKADPEHLEALTYLGHLHLEDGEVKEALGVYLKVLHLWPESPSALYNRAVCLNRLKRTPEEILSWKAYLAHYPWGALARTAADHLNRHGDFEYRNHVVGPRTITLRRIWFELSSDRLWDTSIPSLNFLGSILEKKPDLSIHIVAYQKNNIALAEARAKSVKKYLLNQFPGIKPSRLKLSWFDVPEEIKIGKSKFKEDASIRFFTAVR